jgi:hypothetical protein
MGRRPRAVIRTGAGLERPDFIRVLTLVESTIFAEFPLADLLATLIPDSFSAGLNLSSVLLKAPFVDSTCLRSKRIY